MKSVITVTLAVGLSFLAACNNDRESEVAGSVEPTTQAASNNLEQAAAEAAKEAAVDSRMAQRATKASQAQAVSNSAQ